MADRDVTFVASIKELSKVAVKNPGTVQVVKYMSEDVKSRDCAGIVMKSLIIHVVV